MTSHLAGGEPLAVPTVPALLEHHAGRRPSAAALRAPGGTTVTYGELWTRVRGVAGQLAAKVGPADRVLVPATNTVESVVALLGAMSTAVAVPLNPRATADQAAHIRAKSGAVALLLPSADPARDDLVGAGLRMISLGGTPTDAATFTAPGTDDLALLMETSGSTTAPRLVALTHGQWLDGALRIVTEFGLTAADRTLNLMPLFHNHGLNGAVLATLRAGGEVTCPGDIEFDRLPDWLGESRPTWLTASPVVHAAVLDAVRDFAPRIGALPLRFVRSTSAPMTTDLAARLETALGVPVAQAYALTETAGQVTASPLPPGRAKPGTVGVARHGFEVVVLDEAGEPCAPGVVGEVAVRGGVVCAGYFGDPEATDRLFEGDQVRTGDLGSVDEEGHLRVVGRRGDGINRGGEKVWLPDIDAACLSHPVVKEAMAFGMPHPRLGEDVAVAVVLKEGRELAAGELRHYLSGRLPVHLVPRHVEVVRALPVGPAGKPQRRLLREHVGSPSSQPAAGRVRRSPITVVLSALWSEVLGVDEVGDHDDFLLLGGDSILATRLLAAVSEVLAVDLPSAAVYGEGSTVAGMATLVSAARGGGDEV